MTAGILSSIPRENLVFVPRRINGQLRQGERCIATRSATRLDLPSPLGSAPIEVLNNTGAEVLIFATGGATISGTGIVNGVTFSETRSVGVPAQGRAILTPNEGNWNAVGTYDTRLTFLYNGTPLATNSGNPSSASDLFHYLGILQGGGTWTNPANTAQLVSAASAMEAGTVANLTDRVASGQNVYTTNAAGSWMGWQFVAPFTCTGFWLQTRSADAAHPRSFELRVNTGTGLVSGANITGWPIAQSWTNQTQVTGANQYFYFAVSTPLRGNQLAIRLSGVDSAGLNYLMAQEWNLFGAYEG